MMRIGRRLSAASLLLWAGCLGSCSPEDLVGEGELPPDVSNPDDTNTPRGALAAYQGAVVTFRRTLSESGFSPYIQWSALQSDELTTAGQTFFNHVETNTDRRFLPEFTDPEAELNATLNSGYPVIFHQLHGVRGAAREAARLLRTYAPETSPALVAHAQALEGFAAIYLADLFCSGIPLSTVDESGYTLQPGSTTHEVYEAAAALLETAAAGAGDSVRVLNYARVGRGRALLALGRYADAAAAVAAVPTEFAYQLEFNPFPPDQNRPNPDVSWVWAVSGQGFGFSEGPTMADVQGGNGLDYMSSGDPRTEPAPIAEGLDGPVYLPAGTSPTGSTPIVIASGREARLIEAEAALQGGDIGGWLTRLNDLRRAVTYPPAPDDTTGTPRTLPDLTDPGTADARVDLMFRERAFWLYLTGHRQGDMRRLIREYGRDPNTVYPVGVHARGGSYGADVTAPVPAKERRLNSKFTGCLDRRA